MDTTIEEYLIEVIKHPINTLAVISIITLTACASNLLYQKISWAYKRRKFFKQLEMKLYKD